MRKVSWLKKKQQLWAASSRYGDVKCFVCGKTGGLQVHHLTYANYGREELSDLIYLCGFHHKRLHFDKNGKRTSGNLERLMNMKKIYISRGEKGKKERKIHSRALSKIRKKYKLAEEINSRLDGLYFQTMNCFDKNSCSYKASHKKTNKCPK